MVVRELGKNLTHYGSGRTCGESIKTLMGDASGGVREAVPVVKALSQDLPTYGEAIKAMMGDASWEVREAVVEALSQDPSTHIEVLKVMSDDASCEVRDAAREALEGFADDTRADPTATSTATAHSAEAAASASNPADPTASTLTPAASTPAPVATKTTKRRTKSSVRAIHMTSLAAKKQKTVRFTPLQRSTPPRFATPFYTHADRSTLPKAWMLIPRILHAGSPTRS